MSKAAIYRITNTTNGKIYIGSTKNSPKKRWGEHTRRLRGQRHNNRYLQNAWSKSGPGAFLFEVIEVCEPEVQFEREQVHMDASGCLDREFGYNLAHRANGGGANHHSGEDNGNALLTEAQVGEIKIKLLAGAKLIDLASQYAVSIVAISHIMCDNTWRGIAEPEGWSKRPRREKKVTQEQAQEILILLGQGLSQARIGKLFGIGSSSVSRIKLRQGRWSSLS